MIDLLTRLPTALRERFLAGRNIYSDSLVTSLWTIAGRSVGFFIPFLIAFLFGVNQHTDLFFFALGLLQYLSFMLGDSPKGAAAPYLAERSADSESLRRFVSGQMLIGTAAIVLTLVVLGGLLEPVLARTTPYSPAAIRSIASLCIGGCTLVVLSGCTGALSSLLGYFKRFHTPAVSPAIRSLVVLASMVLFRRFLGIYSVLLGYVLGEAACVLFLFHRARARLGFRLDFSRIPFSGVARFHRSAFFHVAASGAGFVNVFITRAAASHLEVGSVTLLQYASVALHTLSGILIAGFGPVLSAYWAESYHVHGRRAQLPRDIRAASLKILGVSLALWALFALLRVPLTELLYGHGRVPQQLVGPLADYSALYALVLVAAAQRVIFTRYFIILKHNHLLTWIGVMEIPVNLLGCLWLAPRFGLTGVILALVAYQSAGAALSWAWFERKSRKAPSSGAPAV